jgi:glycerophosphoryl diester phosphodiesterase
MHKPLVIAHRGYSSRYPENTQSAYRGAIDIGADIVESDARLSKDGRVFACHDATLARIAGDARAVADMTGDELLAVPLAGEEHLSPLPRTLSDIAPLRPVLIDVKTQDLPIIEAIVRDICDCGAAARVWIGVRDATQMALARNLLPEARLLAFLPDYARADEFERAGAHAYRVWEGQLDEPAAIDVLRDRPTWITLGGKNTPCAVGDTTPERLARILALRPRGVLLNDPALMLGSAAVPSTPETP